MTSKTIGEAENIYTRAAKYEIDNDWNNAFKLYLEAAEAFLHLSRTSHPACKVNATKALERAEKIKQYKRDLAPISIDHFSQHHQCSVLKKSSLINGNRIPLWTTPSTSHDPHAQPSLGSVSPSSVWKSPNDVIPTSSLASLPLLPHDIIQNIVNDCSVCASIAVCIQHHLRFKSNLLLSSLYPSDVPSTTYELKVLVNGDFRRVIIDDHLPFDQHDKLLGISTGPKNQLWPSFVEKAYMKLMGGYDFLGSNSAIDLHVLTGWIPEHIDLKSASFERERTWSRIMTAFPKGDCVMTVGTDDKTALKIHGVKLLPSHDYAVTGIRESNNERWVTLLDSRLCSPLCECLADPSTSACPRVLDLRWDDICATFEGLYISWNPTLFKHTTTFHGTWQPENSEDLPRVSTHHLRLDYKQHATGTSTCEGEVWILLTRHLRDTRRTSEYIALNVQEDDTALGDPEHVALKSNYTNSTHVLSRTRIDQSSGSLSLLACCDGLQEEVGFTVTAYSSIALSWDTEIPPPRYTHKIDGTLASKNAGGNCTHPTYMLNPQYHLRVSADDRHTHAASTKPKAQVTLTAHSARDISLNITAVWSQGERIAELTQKEVVAHSGPYTYGHARVAAHLAAGDYTIVLSAFEPDQTGKFTLKVESTTRFELKSIPQEGAGMYVKTIRGEWNSMTAVGGPRQKRYQNNPIYEVTIPSASEFGARLQLIDRAHGVSTNLSLFSSPSVNSQKCTASSGPYSDALSGVDISRRLIAAGTYYLVPSTYHAGVLAQFRLIIYSTNSGIAVTLRS
ncbi:cysteine proteinase [Rhizopogon vinicolor AM-OR11-026]|uniref:Cysteine proteinase n=1 Tax=Rhizopogon vinicolor AM-OR11-026 TaxID=1314800 RepID=A0A1B7ND63_9AGAM|nr:cysteine proteinase [Rhizopogon vinicolor AM-OR11-026]